MSGVWQRILYSDGRLRALWRILLFTLVFAAIYFAAALLTTILLPAGLVADGILVQSVLVLGAALLAGWILLAGVDGRPPGALGFLWTRQSARELVGGMAIGGLSLAAVVGVLILAGLVAYQPADGGVAEYARALLGYLVLLGIAAAAEEALFRGYPFQVLVQGMGPAGATVLASALFSGAHLANPHVGPVALINIFLAGVLLSVAYLRTRSLWFATAVHLGWNWTMAGVLDLPVSGLDLFPTPLYSAEVGGPAWLTGGAFGPEGGLAATVAFLVALLAVLRLTGFDEAAELRGRRPLVDARLGAWAAGEGSTDSAMTDEGE